jgi:hypothetical protein
MRGETEQAEVEVPTSSVRELGLAPEPSESEDTAKVKAWKLRKEGFAERPNGAGYFSINAVTLNPKQDGLDLMEWHEHQWIAYVDSLDRKAGFQVGKPHPGGIY